MQNQEISLSQIAGVAVSDLIKSAFTNIASGILKSASNLRTEIFEDFKPYMEECYRRNRYVRILCHSDVDVDLLEVYVPTRFSTGELKKSDIELVFDIATGENHVITGSGGAGKTFFMRKMWLDLLAECKRVPIFIELRKLNELSSSNIDALIRASMSINISQEMFDKFCSQGRFVFILDGFDELPRSQHEDVQSQILRLSERFGGCGFVVSGRPDGRFAGWSGFRVYEAEAFSLEQTRDLCSRIPFDNEYRSKFLKVLDERLYSSYRSFLSNPLLSIMMMMVFRRNMDIPKKMGIFYDEAFGTLYQWHDSTKAFKRQKHMDIQQFRRSFGAFCLLSYAKEKFDFSRTELDELIDTSSKLIGLDLSKDDILDDYERNVNLIRQDGIRYYFIHRSFQEYFAAWALTNIFPHKFKEFCARIESRQTDSVIKMCYDLQKELAVSDYVEPRYEHFRSLGEATGKISGRSLWRDTSISVSIHFLAFEESDAPTPLGFSLSFKSGFMDFYRNISLMRGEISEHGAPDAIIHLFISSSGFSLFSSLIKRMDDLRGPSIINFREIDLVDRTVIAKVRRMTGGVEDIHETEHRILLLDNEARSLEVIGKKISQEINKATSWAMSEITSMKRSDRAIDAIFSE